MHDEKKKPERKSQILSLFPSCLRGACVRDGGQSQKEGSQILTIEWRASPNHSMLRTARRKQKAVEKTFEECPCGVSVKTLAITVMMGPGMPLYKKIQRKATNLVFYDRVR